MKKNFYTYLALCTALFLFAGCTIGSGNTETEHTEHASDSLTVLSIGTADSGGTMAPAGKAIAQIIRDSDPAVYVNVNSSNGSYDNIQNISAGNIDLGLVSGDMAYSAIHGTGEFDGAPAKNLRAIAAVYASISQWIAPSSLGLSYVHDLQGYSLGIGPQNSTTELSAQIALSTMNITGSNTDLQNLGIGSGAELVADGTLDAVHGFSGVPTNGISELADKLPCTLLSYTEQELNEIIQNNTYYYIDTIPSGTYTGQDEDIPTFGIKCLLCIDSSADEELVYKLTKILYEHAGELAESESYMSPMQQKGFMYSALPIALHPGAARFYKDVGVLTDVD